jgi:hypothetical protein
MAHVNGIVNITVKGEQKPFRLDLNAVADLEELMDKGFGAILSEENMGFNTIRAFYWAGLKWKDRGLTLHRAGNIVQSMMTEDGYTFETLMEPIKDALIAGGLINASDMEEVDEYDSYDEDAEEDSKN